MHEYATDSLSLLRLNRVKCTDRKLELVRAYFLDDEDECCNDHCNDTDGSGKVVVGTIFAQVLIIDQNRECRVASAYENRRTEIREGSHENQ